MFSQCSNSFLSTYLVFLNTLSMTSASSCLRCHALQAKCPRNASWCWNSSSPTLSVDELFLDGGGLGARAPCLYVVFRGAQVLLNKCLDLQTGMSSLVFRDWYCHALLLQWSQVHRVAGAHCRSSRVGLLHPSRTQDKTRKSVWILGSPGWVWGWMETLALSWAWRTLICIKFCHRKSVVKLVDHSKV